MIQDSKLSTTGRKGSVNEYFTPDLIVRFMWMLILKLGIKNMPVLEPSAGIGAFIKHAPTSFDDITAIEIQQDSASMIPGRAKVHNLPFESFACSAILNGLKYGLIIGNLPFGPRATIGHDKQLQNLTRHELYFMVKSIDLMPDNGIMSVIVPHSIMDSAKLESFRTALSSKLKLISAYRLSDQAFKASGACIMTDVLILQKCKGDPNQFKDYYINHPDHVLGVPGIDRFGKDTITGAITPDMLKRCIMALAPISIKPESPKLEIPKLIEPAPIVDELHTKALAINEMIDNLIRGIGDRTQALEALKEFKHDHDLKSLRKYKDIATLKASWDLDQELESKFYTEAPSTPDRAISAESLIKSSLDLTINPSDLPEHLHHELANYFKIPGQELYTTYENYLSGDIYSKIDYLESIGGHDAIIQDLKSKLRFTSLTDAHISLRDRWIPDYIKNEFTLWYDSELNQNDYSKLGVIKWYTANNVYTVSGNRSDDPDKQWQSHDASLLEKYLNHCGLGGRDHDKESRIQQMRDLETLFKNYLLCSSHVDLLTDLYNRAFNGFIQPEYSTSMIAIPKFNFKLHGYQYQAIRKLLTLGSGICALDVGLGKTLTSIALACKLKADNLAHKPMIVVPKSVMSNWKKEIDKSTQGLKVLYIGEIFKDGGKSSAMSKDQRELALKQCALNSWDMVIISDSAFQQVPLSPEASQAYSDAEFYNDQYGKDLTEYKANKAIDTHKMNQELRKFLNVSDQTFFDDLGIDALIYDEAHALKNFKGSKQNARINYLPSGDGSKRSFDFNAKSAYLRSQNKFSNVYLLTATPTKNNPLEIYAMISHIAPDEWLNRGIHNVDQFIDHYGHIESKMILSPSGEYYETQCLTGFNNLSNLRDILYKYTDMRSAKEVGLKLPEAPNQIMLSDMDDCQVILYESLRERASDIKPDDHLFRIMQEMECAAFAPQLKYPISHGYISPKLKQIIEQVKAHNGQSQLIFTSDLFVESHIIIERALIKAGINLEHIAIANGKTCPKSSDRQRLADKFNSGKIKILIGNDSIIGQGMNLQEQCSVIHHATLPWTPADIIQRNGRAVRQGNTNDSVTIYYYFARGTFDSIRHQALIRKSDWIGDLWRGSSDNYINEQASSSGGLDIHDLQIALSPDPEQARLNLESKKKSALLAYDGKKRVAVYKEYQRLLGIQANIARLSKNNPDSAILAGMQKQFESGIQFLIQSELFTHKSLLPGDDVKHLLSQEMTIIKDEIYIKDDYVSFLYDGKKVYAKIVGVYERSRKLNCEILCNGYLRYSISYHSIEFKDFGRLCVNPEILSDELIEEIKAEQEYLTRL